MIAAQLNMGRKKTRWRSSLQLGEHADKQRESKKFKCTQGGFMVVLTALLSSCASEADVPLRRMCQGLTPLPVCVSRVAPTTIPKSWHCAMELPEQSPPPPLPLPSPFRLFLLAPVFPGRTSADVYFSWRVLGSSEPPISHIFIG